MSKFNYITNLWIDNLATILLFIFVTFNWSFGLNTNTDFWRFYLWNRDTNQK